MVELIILGLGINKTIFINANSANPANSAKPTNSAKKKITKHKLIMCLVAQSINSF